MDQEDGTMLLSRALNLVAPRQSGDDLVPAVEASIPDGKRLVEQCQREGIDATLGRTATCSSGGCTPKVQVMVRRDDLPRVQMLLQRQWLEAAAREGTLDDEFLEKLRTTSPTGDPPCPACGTAAPLVDGACSDCGLQLA
jgi:hypothetical protein